MRTSHAPLFAEEYSVSLLLQSLS